MLTDPQTDMADTAEDLKQLVLQQGGGTLFSIYIDQAIFESVKQAAQNDNSCASCQDIEKFKRDHTTSISNKNDIIPEIQAITRVGGADWPQEYKNNGIVWASSNGSALNKQGVPYEGYTQQQLMKSDTGHYEWLQNVKSNFRTFDHWNENAGIAVSDKTLNTDRATYRNNPNNIKYKIWSDIKKMSIFYEDYTGSDKTKPFFKNINIETYKLQFGIRADTTTREQWEQICLAYQGAQAKWQIYSGGTKPLDFDRIDAISA